jgi:hypothetical protein
VWRRDVRQTPDVSSELPASTFRYKTATAARSLLYSFVGNHPDDSHIEAKTLSEAHCKVIDDPLSLIVQLLDLTVCNQSTGWNVESKS